MPKTSTPKSDEVKLKNLRVFNVIMGFLHFVQGALMLAISTDFSAPLTTNYLNYDAVTKVIAPQIENVGDVQVGPLVALFLFLSATFHFLIAAPGLNKLYNNQIRKGINKFRWAEYSLSSSVMIVAIALLCGVFDLPSLIMLFALNSIMILMGLVMEVHNQTTKKTNWLSFIVGCYAGIVPWIVIAMYFFGALGEYSDIIPDFVYGILGSLFVFFNIFVINMVLQYKKVGPWKDYMFGEKVYIILSLLAKSALAWQVWSGTLRPE